MARAFFTPASRSTRPTPSDAAFWLASVTVGTVLIGLVVYEAMGLGWHPAREQFPGNDPWHWIRAAIVCGLSAWLIYTLIDARAGRASIAPMARAPIAAAWAAIAIGTGSLLLLLVSPAMFWQGSSEDGAMESLSALCLLVAFGFMIGTAWRAVTTRRPTSDWRRVRIVCCAGLAVLFFLMLMEEVSWGQRIFLFATPEPIADRNWQGEFNLHNFQTDIAELALYFGTGIFLLLLPVARETVGDRRWLAPFRSMLPDRAAFAAGAPMLMMTYSHWDLLPIQLVFWVGLFGCLWFAGTSAKRGWRSETLLFGLLAAAVAGGQTLMLLYGDSMLQIYDSSEYREFFISLGLAVYGWRQWQSSRDYPPAWKKS